MMMPDDDAASPAPAAGGTRPPARLSPNALACYGLLLGAAMIVLAWLLTVVLSGRDAQAWFPRAHWASDLALGAVAGSLFALIAWTLLDRIPALKRMEHLIAATLDLARLRWGHAVIFGLLAGIPEEILFRGALQSLLGLAAAAILFGALHAITPAYFLYATLAGILLGGLAAWTGGLWAPIAAHTLIDLLLFLLLIRRWRRDHRA